MSSNYCNQSPVDYVNAQPLYGRPVCVRSFPDKVDVLIVGAGPAGLMAANALSSFGIQVRIIDKRPEGIIIGQADCLQSRTIEVLQSYGLANRLIKEGNQMWEHALWNQGPNGVIERTSCSRNVKVLTARYPFAVTLHQCGIENTFFDAMSTRGLIVDRPTTVEDWEILPPEEAQNAYRIKVILRHLKDINNETNEAQLEGEYSTTMNSENRENKETIIYAKYMIGCDGAHSWVRKKLGIMMHGEHTDHVWGVFDTQLKTNFPDTRRKITIKSLHGTCHGIPREDDMIRLYIQLPETQYDKKEERIDRTTINQEIILESARNIFSPYKLDWPSIDWWTIYIVGQRYASHFIDKTGLIFMAGDACHTHSPKAGQGLNAAINDIHNLAWKLAMVLKGLAYPDILKTYEFERLNYAKELIEFDREYEKIFSGKYAQNIDEDGVTQEQFHKIFEKFGGFTSGLTVQYEASLITAQSLENSMLAEGLPNGKSFISQIVVRHADARPFHLYDQMPTNLRFRILAFVGDCLLASQMKKIEEVATGLEALAKRYTSINNTYDDVIDFITISSNPHTTYEKESLPLFLNQNKWKVFCDEVAYDGTGGNAYNCYKIDKINGALIVIRPDGYVGEIAEVSVAGIKNIENYFTNILIPQT